MASYTFSKAFSAKLLLKECLAAAPGAILSVHEIRGGKGEILHNGSVTSVTLDAVVAAHNPSKVDATPVTAKLEAGSASDAEVQQALATVLKKAGISI